MQGCRAGSNPSPCRAGTSASSRLAAQHRDGLLAAAADGELWKLWYTSVPDPQATAPPGSPTPSSSATNRRDAVRDPAHRTTDGGLSAHPLLQRRRRTPPAGDRPHLLLRAACSARQSTPRPSCCCSPTPSRRLSCLGVELRTHFMNHASRRAIERLGRQARRRAAQPPGDARRQPPGYLRVQHHPR